MLESESSRKEYRSGPESLAELSNFGAGEAILLHHHASHSFLAINGNLRRGYQGVFWGRTGIVPALAPKLDAESAHLGR